MTSPSQPAHRGWIVTLAGLGINLVLGALYAWGVMAKALVVQRHWTKTEAGQPFAVATAAFAVTMIFAGRMQDKLGPRRIALVGAFVFGLGFVASAFATTPAIMMLTFGLLVGVGIGLGYSATTPCAIKWFPPARKGLITGLVVAGVGLAAVYMAPLTQLLLAHTSIQNTFLILGVGGVAFICVLTPLLVNPPAGYTPPVAAAPAAATSRPAPVSRRERDWPEMLRTPQFYLLWLMYVLAAAAGLMIISNAAIIAKEQAGWEAGFVLVMLLAVFNTAGRIVGGLVSDRLGRTRTMLLAFVLQAVNMMFFSQYTTPAILAAGTMFTGLCYGAIFTLMPAATADFYGLKNLGVNYGIVFTGFGVAGVLGSLLGGRVRDLLGSYSMAYTICAAMLAVAAVLAFLTRAPAADTVAPAGQPTPAPAR